MSMSYRLWQIAATKAATSGSGQPTVYLSSHEESWWQSDFTCYTNLKIGKSIDSLNPKNIPFFKGVPPTLNDRYKGNYYRDWEYTIDPVPTFWFTLKQPKL